MGLETLCKTVVGQFANKSILYLYTLFHSIPAFWNRACMSEATLFCQIDKTSHDLYFMSDEGFYDLYICQSTCILWCNR